MSVVSLELVKTFREIGYRNLHLHTDASHLDGMNDIKSLIKRLREIKHDACAVTDHGNMHQVFNFYCRAIENGIKPLLGVEVYMSDSRQLQSKIEFMIASEWLDDEFIYDGDQSHLVLLAKTFRGYQNLCELVTKSNAEGFYGKPRVDFELLRKYKEDVIVINGHVGTDIARSFERFEETGNKKDYNRAYSLNEWYKDVFGDDYYLEIQNHGLEIEDKVTKHVIKLAQDTDVTLVMTNDSHYTWKSDADAHRAHMANGLKTSYAEFMNGSFEGFSTCDEFYIKEDEEMLEVALPYGDIAIQALLNTNEIVDKCNVEIPFVEFKGLDEKGKGKWKTKEYLFPDFPIPTPFASKEAYFEHISTEGLNQRIVNGEVDLVRFTLEDYRKRLRYEMGVINDMGFPTYFTILWDLMNFCEKKDIPVGKGRGSGAGSLVAYSLNITDIDPLRYDLLFERFLNPHRISMPDIDMDFCYDRIEEVIEYTKEKYGHDFVCKIGTYGTLSAKAVIKDIARVMNYDYIKINALTKKVTDLGIKIKEIFDKYPEFPALYNEDEDFKKIIDISRRLEGMQRHSSKHAAGIIISPFPLHEAIPLKGRGMETTAQFDMVELELLGFVKMDYLRLRTLTVVKNTVNAIKNHIGEIIDIDKIDFEDPKVFERFQTGESLGIFQFESTGMQGLLKKQKPSSIEDISAVNALYRPGPLDFVIEDEDDPNYGKTMVDVYLARASGEQEVAYDHPLLESIQKPTYGVFVYQEQVMFASVELAGFSLPESDELRKVVGKKLLDKMPEQRNKFIDGCMNNKLFTSQVEGSALEVATKIWGQIETFGRYGFNKSHATAYATLAYQSMWLKVYYPEFFMASVLTSYVGDKIEKIIPYLNETRNLGIKLLPPDVNTSTMRFEVSRDRKGIHFGLSGIQGVGPKAVQKILEVKARHEFRTLVDFITLTSVNKTVIMALARAGAFDSFGYNRRTMTQVAEDILLINSAIKKKIASNKKRKNPVQDVSSFYNPLYDYNAETLEEFTLDELCRMEKELTGFYMTHHPLEGLIGYIQGKTTHSSTVINNGEFIGLTEEDEDDEDMYVKLAEGQTVITGGVITSVKEITIKRGRNAGKTMASFTIEDAYQGDVKCTIFHNEYRTMKSLIHVGNVVFIRGSIDYFNESAQVNVLEIGEVNRDTARSERLKDLMLELAQVKEMIKDIEEAMELLGDDATLIIDVTNELFALYDKADELGKEIEKGVEVA